MIRYSLSCPYPQTRYLELTITAAVLNQEKTFFQLPAWRPGRYELANFAQNIQKWKAFDEKGRELNSRKITKDLWEVDTQGVNEVSVRYNYYANQLDAGGSYVDQSQLYVNPVNCFLYIPGRIEEEAEIKLDIPENYQIASALNFNLKRIAGIKDFHQLADSPFIASPTLQHEVYAVEKNVFHLWFQGNCKPDWKKIKLDFWNFTRAQLDLFGEFPVNEYHFLYQALNTAFYHGVEHLDSTVIALGPGYKLMENDVYEQFLGVSSHELFHSWNIKSIRPTEMFPYDYTKENYTQLGYVAEGVTTYYGDLMLLRGGVFTFEQYAREVIVFLHRYFHSFGYYYQSVAQASFDTWLDGYKPGAPDRKVNMYVKGMLIAFMLDLSIRKDTQNAESLDTVMRYLYDNYAKKNKGYSEKNYLQAINGITQNSYDSFFKDYVWGIAPIDEALKDAFSYVGLSCTKERAFIECEHYFGLRIKTDVVTGRPTVTQIAPGSPALKAGLALEDEIIGIQNIQAEQNVNDLLKYCQDETVKILIARKKNLLTIEMNRDNGNEFYFPQYKVTKMPDATPEQKRNYKAWAGVEY